MRLPVSALLVLIAACVAVGAFVGPYLPSDKVASMLGNAPAQATPSREAPDPIVVETALAAAGNVVASVSSVGTLQANQSVEIQPEIEGKVASVGFKEGDRVRKGDQLIELDRAILAAELARANATLNFAETEYRRANTLAGQGVGTGRAKEEAASALKIAEANAALAEARLQKTIIVAPFDGIVGLSDVTIGRFLHVGDRIVNLESIDPLKVDFRVPEVFLASLKVGQKISMTVDAFPGQSFIGEVYAIDPLVDVNGRAVKLRARVANPDGHLRPGLFARISLTLDEHDGACLVPESALFPQGGDQFVYVVREGKAHRVKVRLGERSAGEVEILEGVSIGEEVVTSGQLKLFDGAAVAIRK